MRIKCLRWSNIRRSLFEVWLKVLQRRSNKEQMSTMDDHFDPDNSYKSDNCLSIKTIKCYDSEMFKDLLRSGFQFDDIEDSFEITPTIIAVMNGDFEEAKIQHHIEMFKLLDNVNPRMHENIRIEQWTQLEISNLENLILKLKSKGWDSEEIGEVLAKITTELQIQDVVCFNDAAITKGFLQTKTQPFLPDTYRAFEIVTPTLDLQHVKVILENNLGKNITFLMFCRYIINNIDYYHKTRLGRDFLNRVFSWEVFNRENLEYLQIAFSEAKRKYRKIFMKYDFYLLVQNVEAEYSGDCFACFFNNKKDEQFGYDKWIYSHQKSVSLPRKKTNKIYERGYEKWIYSGPKVSSNKNKRSNDRNNGYDRWIYS